MTNDMHQLDGNIPTRPWRLGSLHFLSFAGLFARPNWGPCTGESAFLKFQGKEATQKATPCRQERFSSQTRLRRAGCNCMHARALWAGESEILEQFVKTTQISMHSVQARAQDAKLRRTSGAPPLHLRRTFAALETEKASVRGEGGPECRGGYVCGGRSFCCGLFWLVGWLVVATTYLAPFAHGCFVLGLAHAALMLCWPLMWWLRALPAWPRPCCAYVVLAFDVVA